VTKQREGESTGEHEGGKKGGRGRKGEGGREVTKNPLYDWEGGREGGKGKGRKGEGGRR
jgi:hypothetical protein